MRLILCAAAVALTGCASAMLVTPENAVPMTATSIAGSERTYRNVLTAMRECYPAGRTIESNYFPEAKEGEITLAVVQDLYRVEFAKLKVLPAGDRSRVEMLTNRNFKGFDAALAQWVKGDAGSCPYGTRAEAPYQTHDPYASAPR